MKVNKIGLVVMIILLVFAIFVAITGEAKAQTFIGAGASVNYSSSFDPSDEKKKDGGQTFSGAYVEGGYGIGNRLQARFLADYQTKPTLHSIFTSDADPVYIGRKPTSEFRFRPGLRYSFGEGGPIKPFVEGGVDAFKQFFKFTKAPAPLPAPLPAYYHEEEYEEYYAKPVSAGISPYIKIGARVGEGHEISYSHLFPDVFNDSQLRGERVGYFYQRSLFGKVSVKAGLEADYVTFRDIVPEKGYIAAYDKSDFVARVRVGFIFGGGSK